MKSANHLTASADKEKRETQNRRKQDRRDRGANFLPMQLRPEHNPVTSLLEWLPCGVILIGEDSKPVHLNGKAEEVLKDCKAGLSLNSTSLTCATYEDTQTLRALVRNAVQAGLGQSDNGSGAMSVGNERNSKQLQILVSPLWMESNGNGPGQPRVCAVIFIAMPDQSQKFPLNLLVMLFSLTRAEARLLGELACGKRLEDIATEFSISKNTARAQLKNLFNKTGTSRQVELVKLVLDSPAHLFGMNQEWRPFRSLPGDSMARR